ncbi:MAG: hypothetical protein WCK11_04365 [Candidatus Falkowbacteria bacterium]|jgi:hypothetical protein
MDETTSEIYELVKTKVQEQGAYDPDAYEAVVEETIDYFFEKGKLTDDDNVEFIKEELMAMLDTLKDEVAE